MSTPRTMVGRKRRTGSTGFSAGAAAAAAAAAQRAPTSPPPGTYDPAIDAQVGQANRGLGDLLSDYIRDYGEPGTALGGRSGEDYTLGRDAITRGLENSSSDLSRSSGRTLADLLRDRARGAEDYGQNIAGLQRGFAQLGAAQGQAARAAGVQRGGALAQALLKRQGNEQIARQPIDTGFARFNADSTQAQSRLGEDTTLGLSRLQQGADTDLAGLGRGLVRGTEDAATGLSRAQRENEQFGIDSNALRLYQADLPDSSGASGVAGASTPVAGGGQFAMPSLPAAPRVDRGLDDILARLGIRKPTLTRGPLVRRS